jgi:protein-L-isoaspartate(D-aspartate) O-methyltransferase
MTDEIVALSDGIQYFRRGSEVVAIPPARVTEIMLELLDLQPTDKLLEIGTGSGTQTAEFAKHCKEIHSIELSQVACADYLGNATYLRTGNGALGIPEEAPFNAIVATCGVQDVPSAWKEQLAEGGRLVVPIGSPEVQKLTVFRRKNGIVEPSRIGAYVRFMMMREK